MTDAELLIGVWRMVTEERVCDADFRADGTLTYSIEIEGRTLVMNLTWRLEDGMIVSDQPTASGEVRSKYAFADADTLVMEYDGEESTFRRRA
jgi:hypothetical protein